MPTIEALFQRMFKPVAGGQLRGFSVGSPIDEVRKAEDGDLYEQDFPLPNLQYSYTLEPGFDTEFGVVYYFDDRQRVTEMDFYLEFDNNLYHNISMDEFDRLVRETERYLTGKYGTPRQEEQEVEGEKHQYKYWLDAAAEPKVEVAQILYRDPYSDKEKVMKLVFQEAGT
jgi:hypothetical protein